MVETNGWDKARCGNKPSYSSKLLSLFANPILILPNVCGPSIPSMVLNVSEGLRRSFHWRDDRTSSADHLQRQLDLVDGKQAQTMGKARSDENERGQGYRRFLGSFLLLYV
ncbi:hypothetical protein ScalyP_jg10762 [Parmales sp. scaly parma]|nr:hypothetical protein ScalyP_jg10762 [Parmales sp. scaly parma]